MEGTMKMIRRIHHLFRLNTLKKRLRFWFICLILLCVGLRFISLNLYEKEFLEIQAHNNIKQVINLQQLVINKWFEDKSSTIQTLAQLPDVRGLDEEKMKRVLQTFREHNTEFSGIAFVNKQGVSEINTSGPPGVNLSDRLYFQEAKKGHSYVSDVLIGRQSHQKIITFSSPVYDNEQRFQGLILGSVRVDSINKVMEKLHFSETGQTYLVNREGMLLTEPRFLDPAMKKGTITDFSTKINTEIFRQAIQGKNVIKSYQDYRGAIVFGDYRWVNNHKWLIIGEITKNDVLLPIQRIMMTFTTAMILFLLIGLAITFWVSKRVDRVFHQILEGAHQMGRAKYSYRIDPSSYTHYAHEIQELCETFNEMAAMIEFQIHSVQKSEERYRALVESSPNAIVVHQNGKIVYANPRFIRLLKAASENNLLGKNIIQYVHPDYHVIVKERIQQLERNNPVGLSEEKYILFDGSIIDVEVVATPIEYCDRPAFQVIMHDISKRKEIERELKKSQEQYRSVVENVKEVIFQTDLHGKWTFLNQSWEEITGYTINESIGKSFLDYVHPEDQIQHHRLFQSLIDNKQEYCRDEIRIITKAGGFCWGEIFAQVISNDQSQMIGILGTLNDITQRKESELELKESEEKFRLIAEYSSDMITLHDIRGKYLYASPACKEILQYDAEELVGKDAYLFIHPEDQEIIEQHHQTLLDTGYTVSTYRIRGKDGEYVWFESTIRLLNEIHSDELKLIVVSRNISERKLVEQKLKEANEILQHLSTIDGLTGVSNRRAFDERLELEWSRSIRNSTVLSLVLLDIDYFKNYNDTYGHQGGDDCLKQVASVIQETLGRATDLLCRYGGEEFCVILPDTDETGALRVGEKIRMVIEALKIPHAGSKVLPWVTISVGTATMIPTMNSSITNFISHTDKALYQAKHDGRNCVRSYEELYPVDMQNESNKR